MRSIPFLREVVTLIHYKGHRLECPYRADFVVFGDIIIEIKATKELTDIDRAQVLNYLKATGYTRALLMNYGATSLEFERIVLNHISPSA